MIVQTKAIEPKANSAKSVYPAIIIDAKRLNDTFTNVKFYCPATMPGKPVDANFASDNWIQVPNRPHPDADEYPFTSMDSVTGKGGDLILISYQDGNLKSPQFVSYITIPDYIKNLNSKYVGGADVPTDLTEYDFGDLSTTLLTDNLQKVAVLLPAVTAGQNSGDIISGYDVMANTPVVFYRVGKYGFEYVCKNTNSCDFLQNDQIFTGSDGKTLPLYYSLRSLLKMYSSILNDDKVSKHLIEVLNDTFRNLNLDGVDIKIDSLDNNNALFWCTLLSGLYYSKNGDIQSRFAYSQDKKSFEDIYNLYYSYNIFNNSDRCWLFPTGILIKDDILYSIIKNIFINLDNDDTFSSIFSSRYAIALNNNILNIKSTYNIKSYSNKMFLICAVLASAFYVLEPVIRDLGSFKDSFGEDVSNFIQNVLDNLSEDNDTLRLDSVTIADYFTDIYFKVLGIENFVSIAGGDFYGDDNDKIKEKINNLMLSKINYVLNNYNNIKQNFSESVITQDSDTPYESNVNWIWPTVSTQINSPFGPRTSPTKTDGSIEDHHGMDIYAAFGTDVYAAASGTVVETVDNHKVRGMYITVQCDYDKTMYYRNLHLSSYSVKIGDHVKQGDVICKSGNSGGVAAHLHFEILKGGTGYNNAVDPLIYINTSVTKSSVQKIKQSQTVEFSGKYFDCKMPDNHQDIVYKYCNYYNIEPKRLMALIQTESGFKSDAKSNTNDYGYCQINTIGFSDLKKALGVDVNTTNILEPDLNIRCGAYWLNYHLSHNDYDYNKALVCYNMGLNGGKNWLSSHNNNASSYPYVVKNNENYNNLKYR